jgi:hypothetical protein
MLSYTTKRPAARLRAELAAQHPSIPADTWFPVLNRNPRALHPEPEPGHVWIEVEGRPRMLPADYFEFAEIK